GSGARVRFPLPPHPHPPPPPPPPPDDPPPLEPDEPSPLDPGAVDADATVEASVEPTRSTKELGSHHMHGPRNTRPAVPPPAAAAAASTPANRSAQRFSTSSATA